MESELKKNRHDEKKRKVEIRSLNELTLYTFHTNLLLSHSLHFVSSEYTHYAHATDVLFFLRWILCRLIIWFLIYLTLFWKKIFCSKILVDFTKKNLCITLLTLLEIVAQKWKNLFTKCQFNCKRIKYWNRFLEMFKKKTKKKPKIRIAIWCRI